MPLCPFCNSEVSRGAKFCAGCGKDISRKTSSDCPSCGTEIIPGKKFCHKCGADVGSEEVSVQKKSKSSVSSVIVVFVIIGIIGVTVIYPAFIKARSHGQLAVCESDLKNIATALAMYEYDFKDYPASLEELTRSSGGGYMKTIPTCPACKKPYIYEKGNKTYVLKCGDENAHIKTGQVARGYFPAYTPEKGLILSGDYMNSVSTPSETSTADNRDTPTASKTNTPIPEPAKIIIPEMVLIKGGTFHMGSDNYSNERPVHEVTLSSFYIGKYEVTNKEYNVFLNSEGNQTEGGVTWISIKDDNYCGITGGPSAGTFNVKSDYEKRPVVYVTWYGAVAYCNWLSRETGKKFRLPAEAEWEYACRGETTTCYYWGDSMNGAYCWYSDNSNGNHHRVGQKKPNPYGLYDICGNVWEWCADWYGHYPSTSVTDPIGLDSGKYRVGRGGGWCGDEFCQSADRGYNLPDYQKNDVGFRVVKTE